MTIRLDFMFIWEQKESIFARDNYRCVMCGRGIQDGAKLHIDPIKAANLKGEIAIVGGLTLCELHTFIGEEGKETISEMFARLNKEAVEVDDRRAEAFYSKILKVYERYNGGEEVMLYGR